MVLLHSGFSAFFSTFAFFLRVEAEHVEKQMKSNDFSISIRFISKVVPLKVVRRRSER